jgi:hypothetical protein
MPLQVINGPIIEAGESLSNGIEVGGDLVRITMPATWKPEANLTFQISSDGEFFNDLFSLDGDEVMIPVVPGSGVVIPRDMLRGVGFIKFRSGRAEQGQPQEAQREFSVAVETLT